MKIICDLMKILESDEGFLLTNGQIYTDKVFLGVGADPDEWFEVSIEEVPGNERLFEENSYFNEELV